MLYLAALGLGVIASLFALWPLLSRRRTTVEHDQFMRDLYRDRVDELEHEPHDPEVRRVMQDELGAVLLVESELVSHRDQDSVSGQDGASRQDGASSTHPREPAKALMFAIAFATLVMGYAVYWTSADVGQLDVVGAEDIMMMSPDTHRALIENWSQRLAQRVQDEPDDAKSWYLLGHTYLKLGGYQQAAQAFASTHHLVEQDLTVQVYWLQARYLAAQGQMDDVSVKLAQEILAEDPSNSGVLEILAFDASAQGASAEAIGYLNRAMQGSRDLSRQAALAAALRQAREFLDPAPRGVEVEVTANHPLPNTATIFVIVRPLGGGMPYAVVRRPALMVPFTVTMDDLVSMSGERNLSSADEFEVVVRLSRSGTAMAQSDDWQWLSEPMKLAPTGSLSVTAGLAPPVPAMERPPVPGR